MSKEGIEAQVSSALDFLGGGGVGSVVDDMAAALQRQLSKNSVPFSTPGLKGHIDLSGKSHFDKVSKNIIPTPHVQIKPINIGPNGQINLGKEVTVPATKQDIRTARELERRRGNLQ
ncbi:MAG: hypothetical protein AAGH40_05675 [Verrucomicrobiota bacterium]